MGTFHVGWVGRDALISCPGKRHPCLWVGWGLPEATLVT